MLPRGEGHETDGSDDYWKEVTFQVVVIGVVKVPERKEEEEEEITSPHDSDTLPYVFLLQRLGCIECLGNPYLVSAALYLG